MTIPDEDSTDDALLLALSVVDQLLHEATKAKTQDEMVALIANARRQLQEAITSAHPDLKQAPE